VNSLGDGSKFRIADVLTLIFLIGNLVIRFGTIFYYPPYNGYIAIFLGCGILGCGFVVIYPKYLKELLFLFGFSFFFFGFGSPDLQSRVFELIVTCIATTLFLINKRAKAKNGVSEKLTLLILCYACLSVFSLLLMPVKQIVRDFWFFGFPDAFYYLFIGPPYGFYYAVALVIQLLLFVVLAIQFSKGDDRNNTFKYLFAGIFSGAVFCAFIGLLDFYGIISLAWYRFGSTVTPGVLHSTFQNRNCFAEYVLTATPFAMIGFMSRINKLWWKVFLFGCLVICEIALILSGGRAGWVTYPLILFFCWSFSYFLKEGRFEIVHFRWMDFAKVAVSVPVTIVISLLLIFYGLMPLTDHLKSIGGIQGINTGSGDTAQFLKDQVVRIEKLDTSGRDVTVGQGINVGKERPVYGMGYESFLWQAHNLIKIPGSSFSKFCGADPFIHDSPHNVFLSIFVSGGVVGLFLWLLIIGYAVMILIADLIKNQNLFNIPVIISIVSFHIYGLFQTMQYIPMIWLLIFLSLGYALTVCDEVLPARVRRVSALLTKISVVLVGVGLLVYAANFESRDLAVKYGLRIYDQDQERDRYAGFFQPSQRWQYGDYRWCGKRGAVYVPGGGDVGLEFRCQTPGVDKEPLVLTVFHEGRVLDTISFSKEESVIKKYSLPETPGKDREIVLEVSRTWNAHKYLKNFDRRDLGIGVKKL
jgi:O-antigen ligase